MKEQKEIRTVAKIFLKVSGEFNLMETSQVWRLIQSNTAHVNHRNYCLLRKYQERKFSR